MSQPNSSIYHDVPVLIQPQSWACWYTSFQMVVQYQRKRGRATGLKDPSEVAWVKAIYDANNGIGATSDEREKVATALGFKTSFSSMSADGIWEILQRAPIIYAGHWPNIASGHFVVITGISENTVSINNPASGRQTYDYNWLAGLLLKQTAERPLIFP